MTALGALLGACLVLGLALIFSGLRPQEVDPARPKAIKRSRKLPHVQLGRFAIAVMGVVVLAVVVATVSGRILMLAIVPLLSWLSWTMLRPPKDLSSLEKSKGLQGWARRLSGLLLTGASSLEGAIRASLESAPPQIRPHVAALVSNLNGHQRIEPALRQWADSLDDESADTVAAVLIMNSRVRTGGTAQALNALSDTIAARTKMLQKMDAQRAGIRFTVIFQIGIIIAMTLATFAVPQLAVFYDTFGGQLLLLVVLLALTALMLWYRSLSRGVRRPRFLTTTTPMRRS